VERFRALSTQLRNKLGPIAPPKHADLALLTPTLAEVRQDAVDVAVAGEDIDDRGGERVARVPNEGCKFILKCVRLRIGPGDSFAHLTHQVLVDLG